MQKNIGKFRTGITHAAGNTKHVEIAVSLKYLSNF